MSVISVRTALSNKLNQVGSLHGVFDYEKGTPTGYPFATLTLESGDTEWGDSAGSTSARNIQSATFNIRVYQEREKDLFGPEKAERVSIEVLDEILEALQMDTTLSGAVAWQRPVSWSAGYEIRENVVRLLEITVETVEVVNSK